MNAYFPLSSHYLMAILHEGTLYSPSVQRILAGQLPSGVDRSLFANGVVNSEQAIKLCMPYRESIDERIKELADTALGLGDASFFDELKRLKVNSSRSMAFFYCKKSQGDDEVKKLYEMLKEVYVVLLPSKERAGRGKKEKIVLEVVTEKSMEFIQGVGMVFVEDEVSLDKWKRLFVSDVKKVCNAVRSAGVENLEVCKYESFK